MRFFLMVVKIATSWLDSFNRGDAWNKFVCGNHGSVCPQTYAMTGGEVRCGMEMRGMEVLHRSHFILSPFAGYRVVCSQHKRHALDEELHAIASFASADRHCCLQRTGDPLARPGISAERRRQGAAAIINRPQSAGELPHVCFLQSGESVRHGR